MAVPITIVHRYVTQAAGGGGVGTIGDPWTLAEAFTNAAAPGDGQMFVWIKNDNVYNLPAGDEVDGAPVITNDEHIWFVGYHSSVNEGTLTSDMDYGQTYYGGCLNPGAGNAWADFDGGNIAGDMLLIDGKDNIHFRNIYFHNTSGDNNNAIQFANNPMGISFINCLFYDVYDGWAGQLAWPLLDNCWFGDTIRHLPVNSVASGGVIVQSCFFKQAAGCTGNIFGSEALLIGSIFVGGQAAVDMNAMRCTSINCVYHLQTDKVFDMAGNSLLSGYNNIITPAAQADFAIHIAGNGLFGMSGGSIQYWDYNCVYSIGNGALVQPFSAYGTEDLTMQNPHDIEVDPLFVDAASDDFRLKPGSPCLNTGRPTLDDGGYTNMGMWQKKQLIHPGIQRIGV